MRRIIFMALLIIFIAGISLAGEKEELLLEQKYLEEKVTRIRFQQQLLGQAEQEALTRHQEVLKRLEEISKPAGQPQPQPQSQPKPQTEKKKEAPVK